MFGIITKDKLTKIPVAFTNYITNNDNQFDGYVTPTTLETNDDLIVGAPYNNAGGSNAGRAYVIFGGPGPFPFASAATAAEITLTGELSNGWFGSRVSGVGDVNCACATSSDIEMECDF